MTYLGASQVALVVKNPPANAGDIRDLGSIPGLGGCPGGGHGNPLQYSCLEKPMDRGACWATVHRGANSQTWLKQLSTVHTWLTSFIKMKKLISSQINGKFHLNQSEDANQGNSLSESSEDSSEEVSRGEASMSVTLEFRGYSQAHILLEGYCSSFRNRHLS